jgi:cytochrome d ubiquinol oxidase subunit II
MGPWLLPGALTLEAAAAPPTILRPVLWALALGAGVLVPSFVWLFAVFKRR